MVGAARRSAPLAKNPPWLASWDRNSKTIVDVGLTNPGCGTWHRAFVHRVIATRVLGSEVIAKIVTCQSHYFGLIRNSSLTEGCSPW